MQRPTNLSPQQLAELIEAERIQKLRNQPEFNKILLVMKSAVDSALAELEANDIPRLAHAYALRWRERKHMYDAIQNYIENVSAQRREEVKAILESLGIHDPDVLERNENMMFSDLESMFKTEAQNGNKH